MKEFIFSETLATILKDMVKEDIQEVIQVLPSEITGDAADFKVTVKWEMVKKGNKNA